MSTAEALDVERMIDLQQQQIDTSRSELEDVLVPVLAEAVARQRDGGAGVAGAVRRQAEVSLSPHIAAVAVAVYRATANSAGAPPAQGVAVPRATTSAVDSVVNWSRDHVQADPDPFPRVDRTWSEAAARTLSTQIVSEVAVEISGDLPSIGTSLNKVWVSTADGKVRDSHWKLHGKSVPLDSPFWSGPFGQELAYPGDPRAPLNETIGCRCQMVLIPASTADVRRLMGWTVENPLAASAGWRGSSTNDDVLFDDYAPRAQHRPEMLPFPFKNTSKSAFMAALPANPVDFAVPGGLPPEELHATVGYLGKKTDADVLPEAFHAIGRACASCQQPATATVVGVEQFGSENPDGPAIVLVLDSPSLNTMHETLTRELSGAGALTQAYMKYPYQPHITLGYGISEELAQPFIGKTLTLDRLVSTWGELPARHYRFNDL